jgi:hypothetical protein
MSNSNRKLVVYKNIYLFIGKDNIICSTRSYIENMSNSHRSWLFIKIFVGFKSRIAYLLGETEIYK